MSADWALQADASWRLSLPCTRAGAEILAGADALPGVPPEVAIVITEPDEAAPDAWRIDAYVEGPPPAGLAEALRALVPGAPPPTVERLDDSDWVALSQAWLEPVDAGRFHVHTARHAGRAPAGAIPFLIEAGRAFGTGHHETTAGCLAMLDALETEGHRFARIADLGTGTGLLALAARALWPDAAILASDIDPVAIEVAAATLLANGAAVGPGIGAIELVAADGVDHPAIAARAPFDLVVANILAGPLIALAPAIAAALAPGGMVMLAGLLADQGAAVAAAYAPHGLAVTRRADRGDWPVLVLAAPAGG